ncbi:hypothetical protein SSYIS1_13060 [Serratia symbiotica]|uniref:Uncharacterized protein n=1 Tax=Serratia symbiotica TaxID=138074 RepID=A0A455VPI3_9GAMM|nr:hypothetical protein SSYIS1_13060 [Serratia symbiotica]
MKQGYRRRSRTDKLASNNVSLSVEQTANVYQETLVLAHRRRFIAR